MDAEARALAKVLLAHHRAVCWPKRGTQPSIESCLITYGVPCDRAGAPHLQRSVGGFLAQVAGWCEKNGWPPINALAVNKELRMPGGGYDGAPGCSLLNWPAEVRAAIDCENYPLTLDL